jgi:predicted rRNA methylase YqxC with S4 and FtsJ domains
MNWTIDSNLAGERLDQALVALDPSLSRGIWQKRIKDGEVFVNDKAVLRPHQTVPEGAQVRFEAREKKPTRQP